MLKKASLDFDKMDQLSEKKIPFFFMVDFLVENVVVLEQENIAKNSLLVDFPNFKSSFFIDKYQDQLEMSSFPMSKEDYEKGFDIVQENLKFGNSYLTNYTTKTPIEINLSLEEIFKYSKAKYKLIWKDEFVVFSPETFVEIKNNVISTHPMKGTIDASIENAAEVLKNDIKEKAEHYTVVDLLRNDLSIVASDVQVDDFQRIDYIQTPDKSLFAMSSEISGNVKLEFQGKIGSILKKLLPAGSILGAPKPKTLEIVLEAENYERGFYTGVCGYFDGENLDSCVMIRFIENENGKLFFKSGGGITHLSKLDDEYQEMKNKIYVPIY